MAETVELTRAEEALARAWAEIGSSSRPPARMRSLIEDLISASDVTFKYILVTGYLAKYVNPKIHARALQTGSSLKGAYDARSLCHKVVVSFEKSKGNLFGLSNEPFVNKPARHPEHDEANPQLRNRSLAQQLHSALELAQSGSRGDVFQGLIHILRLGSARAASDKRVKSTAKGNLTELVAFIKEFLQEADGGARLVGVWGAFTQLLSEEGEIKVHSPNTADLYAKTAGDVEVFYGNVLISASECKQRPLNEDDVNHGIGKAIKNGVPEYNFVLSAGIVGGHEKAIAKIIKENEDSIDIAMIDIWSVAELLSAALNPLRRAKFGAVLVELLREMRKFESANAGRSFGTKL